MKPNPRIVSMIQYADIQVKNRITDMYLSYELNLRDIEGIIEASMVPVVVIPGDLFEYAEPNDSERELIYNHIARVLQVSTVRELVVMLGNHDLIQEKKDTEANRGNNPIKTLQEFLGRLSPELYRKVNYLREQRVYPSVAVDGLEWVSYSLENGTSAGSNLDKSQVNPDALSISLHHDILREYVDDKKMPVSPHKYKHLAAIDDFPTSTVLAGDIHEFYVRKSSINDITYFYPGSTIQRNHGEGHYLTIRGGHPQVQLGDKKRVLLHTYDLQDRRHIGFETVELVDQLTYVTVDINTTERHEDVLGSLKLALQQDIWGANQTFFKLKLSNVYKDLELQLAEAIQERAKELGHANVGIELRYDKILQKSTTKGQVMKEIIASIVTHDSVDSEGNPVNLEDAIDEITDDNIADKFSEVILSKDKLSRLFRSQVELNKMDIINQLGDASMYEEVRDFICQLFDSEIEFAYGSQSNYNVEFESIETNGFMQLGKNKVPLDIPGLTRITGTNGVGKTTLYNQIYWTIRGVLFGDLKSNQAMQNSLLVFNDELPENDVVVSRLKTKVNGTPVAIIRSVVRKWKSSAKPEDKASIDWRKFVESTTRSLKIQIDSKNNGLVEKAGDEAEALVKGWFGNVADNIMILNQFKINSMLNMNFNDLRQMVMDYIGVDYIKLLDANVDGLKGQFNLKRPERKKDVVILDIKDAKDKLQEMEDTSIEDVARRLAEGREEIRSRTQVKDNVNQELINLGNVPQLIEDAKSSITETEAAVDAFEKREPLEMPVLEAKQPQQPQNISELEKLVSEVKTEIDNHNGEIEKQKSSIESSYGELYNAFKENITKVEGMVSAEYTKLAESHMSVVEACRSNLASHASRFDELEKHVLEAYWQESALKQELENKVLLLEQKNKELRQQIDSGVCSECGRALEEDFESHREEKLKQIDANIEELRRLRSFLLLDEGGHYVMDNGGEVNITSGLNSTVKSLENLRSRLELIKASTDIKDISQVDFQMWNGDTFGRELTREDWNTVVSEYIVSRAKLALEMQTVKAFQDNLESHANELIIKLKSKVQELKQQQDSTSLKTIDVSPEAINHANYPAAGKVYDAKAELTSMLQKLDNLQTKKHEREDELRETKKTHEDATLVYNEALKKHNDRIQEVVEHNSSVSEHNKKLDELTLKLGNLKNDLFLLENSKLPKYEENKKSYDEIKEEIDAKSKALEELQEELTTLEIEKNNMKNRLEELNKEYGDIIQYQKDLTIYNTYSKIIKKDFKDVVFAYYREFLNITFNLLLEDIDFKLHWHENGELYFFKIKNGQEVFRPVQLVSGMQTCFLGLSLIYAVHLLNVKNNISCVFIDEISGQLNSGKELSQQDDVVNYQEQLLMLLAKFKNKNVFIIDHVIKQMFQTTTYEVRATDAGSVYFEI